MKKSIDEINSALSEASGILLECNEKAIVLKACNDLAAPEKGFPGIKDEDIGLLYRGMSRILYEIVEQISEAQSLIGNVEGCIDGLYKPVKEVSA
jgi:hypothetical protein